MRKEVRLFASWMEAMLQKNDHKGGWKDEDLSYLFYRLEEEIEELKKKLPKDWLWDSVKDTTSVIEECADVANFAMMIASNLEAGK